MTKGQSESRRAARIATVAKVNWSTPALLVLFGATLLASACSSSASEQGAATSSARAGAGAKAEGAEGAADDADDAGATASDASSTETGASSSVSEVIEIEADDEDRPHNLLASVPAEPTPATVSWREVTSDEGEIDFVYFAGGVLARIGEAYYERDPNGALVRLAELERPEGELFGYWPEDAWRLRAEAVEASPDAPPSELGPSFRYQLDQLDEDRSWLPREYRGESTWTGEARSIRKGWLAGALIRDGSRLTRLGSVRPAAKIGPRMGKRILDVFETRAGEVYSISERPNGVYAQRDCEERACVQENARRLPHGHDWSFSMQVPRQQHSLSMVAQVIEDGVEGVMLLHYERGGWKLENLARAPRGLWPDHDGGLWIVIGGALWHRDVGGDWREVALPDGAASISAAMLLDQSELWLAASVGGRGVIFATAASGPER